MRFWKLASAAIALAFSLNINAAILRTLNGIEYEWLELSATQGMSVNQVEAMFDDPSSLLFGYEYASQALVENLFLSYSSWDGLNGWHGDPIVVSNLRNFQALFGVTNIETTDFAEASLINYTVDGYSNNHFQYMKDVTYGIYDSSGECGGLPCLSIIATAYTTDGIDVATHQSWADGWDHTSSSFRVVGYDTADIRFGSYLVREVSAVPVPAAIWLFGSGLIGLIGLTRRKSYA